MVKSEKAANPGGRPKSGSVPVMVRIPSEMAARLEAFAAKHKESVQAVIRGLIAEAVAESNGATRGPPPRPQPAEAIAVAAHGGRGSPGVHPITAMSGREASADTSPPSSSAQPRPPPDHG